MIQDDQLRAIYRALQDGLACKLPLDSLIKATSLWLDGESLKAKLTEHYVHDGRYGLAFVPPDRHFSEDGYSIVPLKEGEQRVPTVVVAIPRETMDQVLAAPLSQRFETLAQLEAYRIAAEWNLLGRPLPPDVAMLFEDEENEDEELE